MILAFETLRDLVFDVPATKDEELLYEPFAFDDAMAQNPSTFSLVFYIDGINYQYDISVQENTIPSEQLSYRSEGRKTLVFSRTFDVAEKVAKLPVGKVCGLFCKRKTVLSGNTLGNGACCLHVKNQHPFANTGGRDDLLQGDVPSLHRAGYFVAELEHQHTCQGRVEKRFLCSICVLHNLGL